MLHEAVAGFLLLLAALAVAGAEAHEIYGALGLLLSPLALAYYALLSIRKRTNFLGDLRGRLGGGKLTVPLGSLWLHGASVGEIALAERILAQLDPDGELPVVVSAVTAAGLARAQQLGPRVRACLHPLDLPFVAARAVRRIRPRLLVLVEGDYWLLTLLAARKQGARIVVINARISEKAFRRMRWAGFYYRACFRLVDEFLPRSEGDRERLRAFGVKAAQLGLIADLKFDLAPPPASPLPAGGPLLIAASLYENEFAPLLAAFAEAKIQTQTLRLLLAPRRKEEFSAAWSALTQFAQARGWRAVRRSEFPAAAAWPAADLYLLDSFGELSGCFAGAQLAFIGGSLFPRGGQNPLEAAAAGVPVLYGPSMENFARAIEQLKAAGAAIAVERHTLTATLCGLLDSPEALVLAGERAAALVRANRGTLGRATDRLRAYWNAARLHGPLTPPPPRGPLPGWAQIILTPPGLLWKFLLALRGDWPRRGEKLFAPVISVGNLTLGGTGKTPAVVYLARELQRRGKQVAILSRGYGRNSSGPLLITNGAGPAPDPAQCGDEPALLAAALPGVAIAVAADRREAAARVASLSPDVLLLDDGFQHTRIVRDLNICLMDAGAPLSTGLPLPWGALREPLKALDRADLQLFPRRECSGFTRLADGVAVSPAEIPGPVLAYCAIAQPAQFFSLLETQGVRLALHESRRDHHHPEAEEFSSLLTRAQAAGARAVVTTAKDAVKLRARDFAIWPLPVFILNIELAFSAADSAKLNRAIDELFAEL